jgi:quercetin dioxygenase-like cupin family protein
MYRIDFNQIKWETTEQGVSAKSFQEETRQIRLLEFGPDLNHQEWCEIGHLGYVLEGEFEIEFANQVIKFKKGDGISIPPGEKDKHRPKALSKKVRLIFFEEL